MSNPLESEFNLENLEQQLLPAWAKETSSTNRYANVRGDEEFGGGRRPRRDGPGGGGRGPGGPRRDGGGGFGGPRSDRGGDRGDRRGGPRRDDRGGRFGDRREEPRREPLPPLPSLNVSILPEDKGVDALARQIKLTGRAYPLFDIGFLIIKRPERYVVRFETQKNSDGTPVQPLFICRLDDTIWLNEQDAVSHVLTKHFDTFYQTEKTATDKPKGVYTFVAQCGMSGEILGPPNYHDYQNKLRHLHQERFARMPFEAFKARVRIVKDEEVVKKWLEDQSWKTEFIPLNVPEPVKLANREAVEKHFRETHLANIVQPVESHTIIGTATQNIPIGPLRALFRRNLDEQLKFPLKLVTVLSQQFAGLGLQFFKVDKTVTHVAVARPHYLDLAVTPVSDSIKGIIEFINKTEKCTRRKIYDALAPTPAAPAAPAPEAAAAAPAEGEAKPAAPAAPAQAELTPEQKLITQDLHWLIHQGHVIEFANGIIETAKKPGPKPEKQAAQQQAQQPKAAKEKPLSTKGRKHDYLPVFMSVAPIVI
ncbi:MAG TPA: hypothetical protein VGH19_02015 [Verrucomicrobiae bacterium]